MVVCRTWFCSPAGRETCGWSPEYLAINPNNPNLSRWLDELLQRPAFVKAIAMQPAEAGAAARRSRHGYLPRSTNARSVMMTYGRSSKLRFWPSNRWICRSPMP